MITTLYPYIFIQKVNCACVRERGGCCDYAGERERERRERCLCLFNVGYLFDVVITTPTIEAGASFDTDHFDKNCGNVR